MSKKQNNNEKELMFSCCLWIHTWRFFVGFFLSLWYNTHEGQNERRKVNKKDSKDSNLLHLFIPSNKNKILTNDVLM